MRGDATSTINAVQKTHEPSYCDIVRRECIKHWSSFERWIEEWTIGGPELQSHIHPLAFIIFALFNFASNHISFSLTRLCTFSLWCAIAEVLQLLFLFFLCTLKSVLWAHTHSEKASKALHVEFHQNQHYNSYDAWLRFMNATHKKNKNNEPSEQFDICFQNDSTSTPVE